MRRSKRDLSSSELLSNWESVYKKGHLTFWMLLLLHEIPSYAYEMRDEIVELSKGSICADGNSIYRALKRLEGLGIVGSELRRSNSGPDRRYYRLTKQGKELLARFIQRNILVFNDPSIKQRLDKVVEAERTVTP